MRKSSWFVLAITLLGTAAVPCASASLITWTLSGATFTDGNTASGSFVMDTAVGRVVEISILTTGSGNNNTVQGHYYSMEQYSGGGTQSFSLYDPGELGGDGNYFQLTFDRPLTTYGTTANFVLTSWEGFIGGPARFVASGAAISEPPPGCPNVQPGCANADIFPGATPDCVVDLSDLGQVLANYAPGVGGKTRAQGDVFPLGGGDGIVDLSDLGQMLSDFGTDCR